MFKQRPLSRASSLSSLTFPDDEEMGGGLKKAGKRRARSRSRSTSVSRSRSRSKTPRRPPQSKSRKEEDKENTSVVSKASSSSGYGKVSEKHKGEQENHIFKLIRIILVHYFCKLSTVFFRGHENLC